MGDGRRGMLTDEQVREILRMMCERVERKVIAERFGTSRKTLSKIARRQSYKHVEWHEPIPQAAHVGPRARDPLEIEEMRRLYALGDTLADIGLDFGLHQQTVRNYIRFGTPTPKPGAAPVWTEGRSQYDRLRRPAEEVAEMRRLRHEERWTWQRIADHFAVDPKTIYNYVQFGVATPKARKRIAA